MKVSLRIKILLSFILLITMLIVAGTISILEFNWLSTSVHGLIQNNYKSIEASKSMIEALEREDSGILLLILGELEEGRKTLNASDSAFTNSFNAAKNNLTEENEDVYIKKIEIEYDIYKNKWVRPIVDTDKQGNLSWYRSDIHESFLNTKKAVNELMSLNQQILYDEASFLREKSKRAIMPGIISIISAVVFSLLLNFFITLYFVSPIVRLTEHVNDLRPGQKSIISSISSNDEIKKLETAINQLITRISDKDH